MFVREWQVVQLYTTYDSASKNKVQRIIFLCRGACCSSPVVEVMLFHHSDPTVTPCLLLRAAGASQARPAIINFAVTPRCLPAALWLGTGEVCSTTRPSCRHALGCWQTPQCFHCAPFSLPASGARWQNQRKTVSLLLSNRRKAFQRERGRAKRERAGRIKKKNRLRKDFLL